MNPVRFKYVYGSTWPHHLYGDFWKHYLVNTYIKPEFMHMLTFSLPVSVPSDEEDNTGWMAVAVVVGLAIVWFTWVMMFWK